MNGGDVKTRTVVGNDETLLSFYREISNGIRFMTIPTRLQVEDLEATLSRVWDLGGTIVSIAGAGPGDGSTPAATFADPRGNLVTLVQTRAGAPV